MASLFNKLTPSFVIVIVFLLFPSCTNKNTISPLTVCDSTHISYYKNIQPMIKQNCYSCHSTIATQIGGLNLEDTTALKSYLTFDFRGDGIYGSKLYHCIIHAQLALPMPPTYILDSCSMSMIHYWLLIGAPLK